MGHGGLAPEDVVAIICIVWLVVAIVVDPFIGEHLARRRREDTRPAPEDDAPVGYRPPRD